MARRGGFGGAPPRRGIRKGSGPLRSIPAAALALAVSASSLAAAQKPAETTYVMVTGGAGDVFTGDSVPFFGLELELRQNVFGIHPFAHVAVTTEGDSYLGAGLSYSVRLGPRWQARVSTGPGYYQRGHFWKDLGDKVEFYSAGGVSYDVGGGRWLGVRIGHISNGGLSQHNPGSNVLELTCTIPLR